MGRDVMVGGVVVSTDTNQSCHHTILIYQNHYYLIGPSSGHSI